MAWLDYIVSTKREVKNADAPQAARATIISTVMCKGGVGKTTSTRLISENLAQQGLRVLIIDADPQASLTLSLHLQKLNIFISDETPILMDVISKQAEASEAIIKISENISLIPSTAINAMCDRVMDRNKISVKHLHKRLEPILKSFDFIFFDTAPALNLLNASIIIASDIAILPVCLDEFSKNSLLQTLQEIEDLKNNFYAKVQCKILISRFDRDETSQYYLEHLVQNYKNIILNNMIRQCQSIRERVIGRGLSTADEDFLALAIEIVALKNQMRTQYA